MTRVLLVEAADRVLMSFPESLSKKAARALEQLGVTPLIEHMVVDVSGDSVAIRGPDGKVEQVGTRTVIWAAGVTASGLAATLANAAGIAVDPSGHVAVGPDLTLPGYPDVLAIGDMVRVRAADDTIVPLPGVAPVAIQQGRYAARLVANRLTGRETTAVPLPRQGQPRNDRPIKGRRRHQKASASPASPPG